MMLDSERAGKPHEALAGKMQREEKTTDEKTGKVTSTDASFQEVHEGKRSQRPDRNAGKDDVRISGSVQRRGTRLRKP
jgi:hypothetical protein